MSTTRTTIPDAITAFLSTVSEVVPAGTGVYDGIVRVGQSTNAFVVVTGWDTEQREPATFGSGGGYFSIEEHYLLTGFIRCLEGSEDQTQSRSQAFAIYFAVEDAVREDPTLGGVVRVSWFRRLIGTQGAADGARGNGTQIDWELHVEARLS